MVRPAILVRALSQVPFPGLLLRFARATMYYIFVLSNYWFIWLAVCVVIWPELMFCIDAAERNHVYLLRQKRAEFYFIVNRSRIYTEE